MVSSPSDRPAGLCACEPSRSKRCHSKRRLLRRIAPKSALVSPQEFASMASISDSVFDISLYMSLHLYSQQNSSAANCDLSSPPKTTRRAEAAPPVRHSAETCKIIKPQTAAQFTAERRKAPPRNGRAFAQNRPTVRGARSIGFVQIAVIHTVERPDQLLQVIVVEF